MSEFEGNGWTKYQLLVLHKLNEHSDEIKEVRADISKLTIDVATLKVKAGIWGLMGGLIPVAIALLIEHLK